MDSFLSKNKERDTEKVEPVRVLKIGDCIFYMCLIDENRLISCGNRKIIIWDIDSYQSITTIPMESYTCYITRLSNGFYASNGGKMRIWDIENAKCLYVKEDFWGGDQICEVSNGEIWSTSSSGFIYIFSNYPPYKHIHTIREKSSIFSILELKNKKYVLSSTIDNVKVWNKQTYKCEKVIFDRYSLASNSCNMIELEKGIVIIAASGRVIKIDTEKLQFVSETKIDFLACCQTVFSLTYISNGLCLCGTGKEESGALFIFDANQDKYLIIKRAAHSSLIFSLLLIKNDLIFSCSEDGTIKVWNRNELL